MEPDRVAHALKYGALQIVIEQDTRHTTKGAKGLDVPAQEGVHARVQAKAQEDAPRVAQHHHESHQRALGAADLQVAEVRPVDLRLLAGQRAQAQERFGRAARAHRGHQVAHVAGAAVVAALADHGMQPAGRQRGVLAQRLDHEGAVRIDAGRSQHALDQLKPMLGEHAAHGVAVHVQLARDGAHAPMLGDVQTRNVSGQVRGYGHGAPPGRWPIGAGSPGEPIA